MKNLFPPNFKTSVLISTAITFCNWIPNSYAEKYLGLEEYLSQVKAENPGVKGSLASSSGGELRSVEGELLLAPTAFANFQFAQDARIPQIALLSFDSIVTKTFSLGVKKLTTFGLQANLHYDILSIYYNNPTVTVPGMTSDLVPTSYAVASPVLELTQSLWSNSFGKSTRATQEQLESQALASSYQARFQAKSELSQAEISYWQLALARQTVAVQREALDRAKKIHNWSERRARLHLADQSDAVQAEALMQTRELDLMTALNSERSASRSFNTARYQDSDEVKEQVAPLSAKMIDEIRIPQRAALRDDVKAAQQSSRNAVANAIISLERDSPTLDVFANFSLNGQASPSAGVPAGYRPYAHVSETIGPSFSFNRPSTTVGIRFSAPLDFLTTQKSRDGWKLEQMAADLRYENKHFEQDQSWKDLNETFIEAKKHLELSRKLEIIQDTKLKTERERLHHGRTTTYQVLLFEQDFLLAQLGRIRDQAKVLNIIAQMKLFGESL